jgi:D-amino-acid dehydrogenase
MKVLILGSGLLGVTTAYELGKRGFEVTVIDRQPESARECSHANGAQLSYSHAEPWASPSVLPKLPKWILDPESPLVFHPRADWQMIRWGMAFLRNCTTHRANINCTTLLRLGLYSKEKMQVLRSDTGIAFDFSAKGILHIYGTEKDFDAAKKQNAFQAKFGGEQRELTADQCLSLEPSLMHTSRTIVGGMHAHTDECGDAYLYCNALAKVATERYGVSFEYGTTVREIHTRGESVISVSTDQGTIAADAYVVALGSYSPLFLRLIGINLPIYPMKGYSVTLPANEFSPQLSVTDGSYKVVYSRLGDRLRIAGTAEFAGYNDTINKKRIAPILRAAQTLFPKAEWDAKVSEWACLRPSTPDGPPILGPTRYHNLFLNTGHGTLGWTQAAGSAALVADAIEKKPPEILMQGLTHDRYQ